MNLEKSLLEEMNGLEFFLRLILARLFIYRIDMITGRVWNRCGGRLKNSERIC